MRLNFPNTTLATSLLAASAIALSPQDAAPASIDSPAMTASSAFVASLLAHARTRANPFTRSILWSDPSAGDVSFHRSARAPATGTNDVPESALRALEEMRYFHASLIIREYFAAVKDTAPEDLLIAARAEAGWGDWARVTTLLDGRGWLDRLDDGLGWNLLGRSLYHSEDWDGSLSALARWLDVTKDASPIERGLAELTRARAFAAKKQITEATAAFDRAAALLADAADWIGLAAVEAAAAAGDGALVDTRLARIEPELAREWGWQFRVNARRNADDSAGALAAATEATSALRSASRRADAWVEVGRLRFDLRDVPGARDAFRRAIDAAPGSTGAVNAARLLSDIPGITAEDQLLIGRTYLRHGNGPRAAEGFAAYLNAGKGTAAERERLRFDLGTAYFRAGRYDSAERTLLGIVERNIIPRVAADAMLLGGRAQYRDGRTAQGRRTFVAVASRYPGEEAAPRALYLAADLDQDDGRFELATERFRKATTLSRNAEEVGLAHMRLGGLAFQNGDFAGAFREFDGYRASYPNGRRYVQAAYWAALSARRIGDDATAIARLEEVFRLDPFSYYGGRAAELLGRTFRDVPLRPSPPIDTALHNDVRRALRRVDLLREMDWGAAADYEVNRTRLRFSASKAALYSLAEQLNQRGYTMTAIGIGWELFDRDGGWNDRLLRIIYPFPFQDIIIAEARENGVDPFLAAGLMRQESMFNIDATSGPGAIGLMQVMPATGQTLARQLGVRRFDRDMLKHPELNAHLGMRYLAEQLESFDNRLPIVLAAYNAGPSRIDRWQEFPEFDDDELFAERIPFDETRDYVKIVQNNARLYEALYGPAIRSRGSDR